ncbi:MAG: sigma-70 family RNA polymerase sigma factor [Kofleriaceae bacterium]
MDSTARAAVEADVRARFEAGDLAGAVRVALEAYGSELYGFLVGLARDQGQADDAFSATCEALWKGLPKFRWESTFRVWAYTIARHELLRTARSTSRREVPVSEFPELAQAMLYARTSTRCISAPR